MTDLDDFEYQQATWQYLEQQDLWVQEAIDYCEKKKYNTKSVRSLEWQIEWRNNAAKALQFCRGDFVIYDTITQSYSIGRVQSLHVCKQGRPYLWIEYYTQDRIYKQMGEPVEPSYLQKVGKEVFSSWLKDIGRVLEEVLNSGEEIFFYEDKWLNNLRCWIFVLESERDSRWQRLCWGNSKSWVFAIGMNIAKIFSSCDFLEYQFTQMCENLNGEKLDQPKLLPLLPPASHSLWLDRGWEVVIAEIASRQCSKRYWHCNQNSLLSKMSRDYYPALLHQVEAKVPIFMGSYKDFGRAGIILNGAYYPAESIRSPSLEKGYSWLPAPSALSNPPSSRHNPPGLSRLEGHLRKCNVLKKGECLNPTFLEDCYNIPPGWTDPSVLSLAIELIESAELRWETLSTGGLRRSRSEELSTSTQSNVANHKATSCVTENTKRTGLSISFGPTCDRLLSGKKTVTRRTWKERYAKRFIKAYREGKRIRAIDKDFRYGGKMVGWLTLTREPQKGWTHEITQEDCIKEGYPELSPAKFRNKFFKNPKDWSLPVWILEFEFEPIEQSLEEPEISQLDLSDLPLFEFAQRNITASQAVFTLDAQKAKDRETSATAETSQEKEESNSTVPVPAKSRLQNYIETLGNAGDLYAIPGSRTWAVAIKSELHSLMHDIQFNADQLQAYSGLMKRHEGYKQLVDPQGKAFETYEEFSQSRRPFGLGELPAEQSVPKQLALDLGFSSSDSDDGWDKDCWRTPNNAKQPILDLVVEALGGTIGLDPTSDNQRQVPAQRHFTKADDCLSQSEWSSPAGTVFMNMPYSKPAPFLEKLVEQINRGNVREAIVLLPSSCLQGLACSEIIQQIAMGTCMWKSRIAFLDKDGVPKKGANFCCSLVYFGNNWERFARVFRPWGWVFRSEAEEPAVLTVEVLPPSSRTTDLTESWAAMDLTEPSENTNLTESWGIAVCCDNWPENSQLTENSAVNVIGPSEILRDVVDVTATRIEDENLAELRSAAMLSHETEDVLAERQEAHLAVRELDKPKTGIDGQDITATASRKKRHAFPDQGSGCLQRCVANASRSQGGNPYWLYQCTYIDKETGKQKKRSRYVSKSKYSRVYAMIQERRSCYEILKYLGPPKKKSKKSAS